MNILHTGEFYFPSVGGMQEIVKQISERMVALGHTVTVATTFHPDRKDLIINGVKIEQFNINGNMVVGIKGDTKEIARYKELLKREDFDILVNFMGQHWATDLALPMLKEITAKKILVPEGFSALTDQKYSEYFNSMKEWLKQYDTVVFHSNDYADIDFARASNVKNIVQIPNGAAKGEFLTPAKMDIREKLSIPKDHLLILDIGSHTGVKGHAEAIKIFKKARIKNTTLLILGNSNGRGCEWSCKMKSRLWKYSWQRIFNHKNLIVAEVPRPYVISAHQQADLFLFTSNTECSPIVLIESAAAKTPFLATEVGNSKEMAEWTGSGIILPTVKIPMRKISKPMLLLNQIYSFVIGRKTYAPFLISVAKIKESAKILEQMCNDKDKRIQMAEKGHQAWLERFTWETIADQYQTLYKDLLSK